MAVVFDARDRRVVVRDGTTTTILDENDDGCRDRDDDDDGCVVDDIDLPIPTVWTRRFVVVARRVRSGRSSRCGNVIIDVCYRGRKCGELI